MVALILGHVVLAALLVLARERVGRAAFAIGAAGPAATLAYAITALPDVLDGDIRAASVSWVPSLDLGFDLRLDAYGSVFLLVIGSWFAAMEAANPGFFNFFVIEQHHVGMQINDPLYRRLSRLAVAWWRIRSISSLMLESFSM